MTHPDLWRVGGPWKWSPMGIYSGDRLVRECDEAEAARVVQAHNRYILEPLPSAPDTDDPSDDVEERGVLRDEALRREEQSW